MKYRAKFVLICLVSGIFFLAFYQTIFAYVMYSGSYKIESDSSITPAGGLGSSANYIFQDTMGQVSSGASSSALYKIKAGFQEMQQISLKVTAPSDTLLSPDIPGVSGGIANADTHWTIQTDNTAGFDMKISSSTAPAMKLATDSTYYFDNYAATPTYGWNIGSNSAKFGFTVVPATVNDAAAFKDNGSACGLGGNVGNCWSGLATTPAAIIHRTTRTDANGENELVSFRAESNKLLESGDYAASIVVTISSN